MVNIYYNKNTDRQIDSSGGNSFSAPQLCYQDLPTWRIFFKNVDSAAGTITAVDVSDAVAWKAAVDDDFDHASEVMCRTLDANIDSSQSSLGIIDVLLDANTAPFETAIGTADKKSPVYFQLEGFNTAGKRIHNALIKITATNTVDPLGGDPPNPVGNYYTKTEVDAIAAGKADAIGTDDIEITDADKGYILKDRTTATRYRLFFDNGILSYESIA